MPNRPSHPKFPAASFAMTRAFLLVAAASLLGACASTAPRDTVAEAPAEPEAAPVGVYHAVAGREPAVLAELRAAAPPAQPEIVDGIDLQGERLVQRNAGFLRVGDALADASRPEARQWLVAQGIAATADRVIVYPPATTAAPDATAAPAPAERSTADPGDGNDADDGTDDTATAPPGHSFEDTTTALLFADFYVRVRPPFGATFRDVDAQEKAALKIDGGVRIGTIIGDSPASEANLRAGDVVLRVAGQAVADRAGFLQLLRTHAGRPTQVTVARDGQIFNRTVRLGPLPDTLTP